MDMITTGRSGIDRELVLKLADQVCSLSSFLPLLILFSPPLQLLEVFSHRRGERLTLGQIRQLLSHDTDLVIRTEDLVEAIREIISSSDGGGGGSLTGSSANIQFMENTQTVLIRSGRG
jgi:hypothetical protein